MKLEIGHGVAAFAEASARHGRLRQRLRRAKKVIGPFDLAPFDAWLMACGRTGIGRSDQRYAIIKAC